VEESSVDLSIPASAFVGFASLDLELGGILECIDVADAGDRLESLRNDAISRINRINRDAPEIGRDAFDRLTNREFSSPEDIVERVRDIDITELEVEDPLEDLRGERIIRSNAMINNVINSDGSVDDLTPDQLLGRFFTTQNGAPQEVENAAFRTATTIFNPIEAVSDEIDDLEELAEDEFGQNNECLSEFRDAADELRSDLRGCC